MVYGDYNGPDKPDKGKEGGACNRRLCQAEPADWYNHGSLAWYCADCRRKIQFDTVNYLNWMVNHAPEFGHPMFEAREMMTKREHVPSPDDGIEVVALDFVGELEAARIFQNGNCLRAKNPRVVACHCANCGGK